jgi:Protein of unknown function (DUF2778)
MYTYSQSTGTLLHNGVLIGTGYAGKGAGKNNPDYQNVVDEGPLPRNQYQIGEAYTNPKTGPLTMDLTPTGASPMFGRDAFRMHGDSIDDPGNASEGCIVLPHDVRLSVATSGDYELEVVG